uniref:Uncharacterized protein n=1 Tax=Arundo donax TaxID=35708 RepID=A0A0A9AEZ6_ARUDO
MLLVQLLPVVVHCFGAAWPGKKFQKTCFLLFHSTKNFSFLEGTITHSKPTML